MIATIFLCVCVCVDTIVNGEEWMRPIASVIDVVDFFFVVSLMFGVGIVLISNEIHEIVPSYYGVRMWIPFYQSFLPFSCFSFSSSSNVRCWFHLFLHSFIHLFVCQWCVIFSLEFHTFSFIPLSSRCFFFLFSLLIDKRRCMRTIMYHQRQQLQKQQSMIRFIVYAMALRLKKMAYTRSIMILCETIQQAFMCKWWKTSAPVALTRKS